MVVLQRLSDDPYKMCIRLQTTKKSFRANGLQKTDLM